MSPEDKLKGNLREKDDDLIQPHANTTAVCAHTRNTQSSLSNVISLGDLTNPLSWVLCFDPTHNKEGYKDENQEGGVLPSPVITMTFSFFIHIYMCPSS